MTTYEPDLPELPDLSGPDDEFVRGMLAALPAVQVPETLAGRLDAALREAGHPSQAATTVVALAGLRPARRGPSRATIVQVAAAVVVLATGTVVALRAASTPSTGASSHAVAAAAAGAASRPLTDSGHAYSETTLVSDIRALAAGGTLARSIVAGAPQASPSQPHGGQQSGSAGGISSVPSPATQDQSAVSGPLFASTADLVPCLAAVESGLTTPVEPLALDQGTFRGQPVLVVVLPGSVNPKSTFDVFVVGAGCGQKNDAHLVFFRAVPRN